MNLTGFSKECGRLLPISESISYGYVQSHSRVEASGMSVLETAISSDAKHIKLGKLTEVLASQGCLTASLTLISSSR